MKFIPKDELIQLVSTLTDFEKDMLEVLKLSDSEQKQGEQKW